MGDIWKRINDIWKRINDIWKRLRDIWKQANCGNADGERKARLQKKFKPLKPLKL